MEKILESYKDIILFYVIIALLAFVCCWRLNTLNIVTNEPQVKVNQTYRA